MEEIIHRKSWFNRNWKWVVPTGGCLFLLILIVGFVSSIFFGVTAMLSNSQAHSDAMTRATSNEIVIDRLGQPIESNGMNGGSVHYKNGHSSADITIPIKGPKGAAVIRVEGSGVDEIWTYKKMEVFFPESDEIVTLLNDSNVLE